MGAQVLLEFWVEQQAIVFFYCRKILLYAMSLLFPDTNIMAKHKRNTQTSPSNIPLLSAASQEHHLSMPILT